MIIQVSNHFRVLYHIVCFLLNMHLVCFLFCCLICTFTYCLICTFAMYMLLLYGVAIPPQLFSLMPFFSSVSRSQVYARDC
jgi:hypothetical protein